MLDAADAANVTHMAETKTLASYIVNGRYDDIPADVRHEAARSLVNFMAVALGGSVDPAVDIAIRAMAPFAGKPAAAILGRVERLDPLHASLMNGISSHVDDFDDTTPQNYIHPTSPVASAMFAYASANRVTGRAFVNAFVRIPCQIVRTSRRLVYRLLAWNPWQGVFFRLLDQLALPLRH